MSVVNNTRCGIDGAVRTGDFLRSELTKNYQRHGAASADLGPTQVMITNGHVDEHLSAGALASRDGRHAIDVGWRREHDVSGR